MQRAFMGAQDRTDAKLAAIAPGEYLGVDAPNDKDCPEGYYIVQANSASYQLETAAELPEFLDEDGKPLQLPAGSWVVDGEYLNPVRGVQGAKHWYLPYPTMLTIADDICVCHRISCCMQGSTCSGQQNLQPQPRPGASALAGGPPTQGETQSRGGQ